MSATFPLELKILIEQVVRPLPVTLDRQKRLRSDFQEHLQTIYAEELARDGNPAAALAQTKLRFGDPIELAAELRATIGRGEVAGAWLEAYWLQRTGETTFWYAVRLALRFTCFVAGLLTLVMAEQHFSGKHPLTLPELRAVFAIVTFLSVGIVSFLWFGLQAGDLWEQSSKKWWQMISVSFGLIVSWPLNLMLLMYLANFSWSDLAYPFPIALFGITATLIGGTLLGIFHSRDTRYRHEWASLILN